MSTTIAANPDPLPVIHPFATEGVPEAAQPTRPRGRHGRGSTSVRPRPEAVPRFNFADLIRRARRNAELSQREMADAIGVSKSTIGRAEADSGTTSLPVLLAALAVGGLDLIVMDADGEAFPMRQDALRDRGGRKLPAHLEARVASPSDCVPTHWSGSTRRNAPVQWQLRSRRRLMEALTWQHPSAEDIDITRRRERDEDAFRIVLREAKQRAARQRSTHRPESPPCDCSDACTLHAATCLPTCPCQCESADGRGPTSPEPPSMSQRVNRAVAPRQRTSRPVPLYLPRNKGQVQRDGTETTEGWAEHSDAGGEFSGT